MEVTTLSLQTSPGSAKTADLRGQTRIPQPPSLIPLLSPKSKQALSTSLPSSLSVPQLGLVPPNRTPSGRGPPSQATASPHPPPPPTHASGGTSLPSLRTLRNFLPFGSGKPASSTATSGPLRTFASFAPVRRSSTTIERKNSSQFTRPGEDSDGAVIAIAPSLPPQASPERTRDPSSSAGAHDSSDPSPQSASPLHRELGPPVVTFNPEPPLSSELSTILESDLSGLSKHIPALGLDESQIIDLSGNRYSPNPEASPPSPGTDDDEVVAPDTSVLDLSTSQLKEEVMHALKEKTSTNGWLTGVVVEDVADSRPTSRNGREAHEGYVEVEPEESLRLDSLDPDLAALLSPNRVRGMQPNNLLAVPVPQKPSATTFPRVFPPPRAVTPQSRPSPLGSSPIDGSPSSATGSARSQPSPVRTTHPPGLVRSVPTRFVPRLMRSATDQALTGRADRGVEGFSRTPSDSALQLDETRRVSSDGVYLRRPLASPLPLEFQSQPSLQQTHTEQHRRVTPSRLATPARFGAHAPGASRLLRSALPSPSSTGWGGESPSPTSRASSSLGAAADRLSRPRTSEDGALGGRPSARERLGYTPRNRNRSLSVGNGNGERVPSPGPRTATEWLGPRTAKAFAAAGLLDRDRDLGSSASRFGSMRSLSDRDQRALAPSRLAMSEAGSVVSTWRSVSRAMTHSDLTASTSTGAPRTTRSAESTAPTSISMSRPQSRTPSPQNKTHQAALQALQEKHTTETGTLLAALADAQHIAQSLRTENARLTKRVEVLEAQLVAAHPLARSVFSRAERQNPADALARRRWPPPVPILPGHHPQNSSSRVLDFNCDEDEDAEDATYHGGGCIVAPRRPSDSESMFALPPPNMSMLLQEQPAGSRRSAGSASVTTTGAPTDAPGSPRSLFLRPEHELHLGDMGSLDMRFTEDDADDAGYDEDVL